MIANPSLGVPSLIILVGPPGSGKSTWAKQNGRGAVHVSQVSRCSLIVEFSVFVFNKVHDFNAKILHLNRGSLYLNRVLSPNLGNF